MNTISSKGIINIASPQDTVETANQLEKVLRTNVMNVIARVNHAEAAAGAGMELRPTELLIFGSPQAGTPFMQRNPCAAIDFPQKALVGEDETGKLWIGFNDRGYLADRPGIEGMDQSIDKVRKTLEQFAGDTMA